MGVYLMGSVALLEDGRLHLACSWENEYVQQAKSMKNQKDVIARLQKAYSLCAKIFSKTDGPVLTLSTSM